VSELLEEGPYGLTEINIFNFIDAMVSPLHARVSLSVSTRGPSNPRRLVIVFDAASAIVADAFVTFDADKEAQAQAAQWLLDLCCTRYGIDGTTFKHSDFNLIFK
jgi:hypothetical protein